MPRIPALTVEAPLSRMRVEVVAEGMMATMCYASRKKLGVPVETRRRGEAENGRQTRVLVCRQKASGSRPAPIG